MLEKVIEKIKIKDLILLEKNPRSITKDQMQKLKKSLQDDPEFFFNRPCLVHATDTGLEVYAGNQRIRAAKSLGWKEVPCIIEKNISEEIIKARIIKDNKSYGDWDFDALAASFDIESLLDCGFTAHELELVFKDEISDALQEKKGTVDKDTLTICPNCNHKF